MCNLGQGIEDRALQRGMERGVEKSLVASVCNLMKKKDYPKEEAMDILEVSKDRWNEISALVDQELSK